MLQILTNDIENLDKNKRTNLINCLSGLRAANLIGTINNIGVSNLSIFNCFIFQFNLYKEILSDL